MVRKVSRADGSIAEVGPERCANGHQLRYPNVIVSMWTNPVTGHRCRAWYCRICRTTIYDDPPAR